MKKIWISLIGIIFTFTALGAEFTEGHQYIKLENSITREPQVVEFFSFYCKHCYEFDEVYHIFNAVKKVLPINTTITKYHVSFLGPLGKQLTQAWAVAMILGIEDKVGPLLFDNLQKQHIIQTSDDIRAIFIKAGVRIKEYDSAWNSFMVKLLVIKQEKAADNLHLRSVPAMLVNGKYMVKNDGLDLLWVDDDYVKQFSNLVKFLLSQQ
ncbi:thiol:disulfide interchange protein DsbA [Candidatus Steffania adelgidicola]|uniref:thiol:disulfide interchange protein DsbA n=1 Tax=Candidatus Steffania adelgidicola TaxID=1076626 RepID=UPI001D00BDC5|nr:thiol:disulfide interchange protein DsbA [Candidatus Steffania adelgidicola]UDG79563.1 Thiol:disulfide interchange protein DsbA [Candidatus Steffania adelgidicola]